MNATTYRLTKVVTNSASTINVIVDNKVYRNDVGNHVKTELRNTLNDLCCYIDEYAKGKLSCLEIHSCLVDTRLKLSELSDMITDKVFMDDPHLLLTHTVYDSITTLRQIIYILMTQIAIHEL
jgi:hypothetical protein